MAREAGAECTLLSISALEPLLQHAPARGHITVAAYYRIFLPEILPPQVRRVIYLDSDVIVRRSVDELWSVELGGNAVAAVMKPRAAEFKAVGLKAETDYFNSGVLVIDTSLWREQKVREKALDFALHHPGCVHGHDQPALNHVFAGRWTRLDLRWNQQFKFFMHTAGYLRMSRTELRQLRRDPFIIHYTTCAKPWNPLNEHPLRHHYYEVLDRTPFAGWRPEPAQWQDRLWRLLARPVPHYLRPQVVRNVCRPHYHLLKERLHLVPRRPVHG
jgi:lipopolysaccharide biosynthesis glycosyltransferase